MRYIWNILIAVDQLGNAILGGDPDETISSRLGKWRGKTGWRRVVALAVCYVLHCLDPRHCRKSIEQDEGSNAVIK